MEVTLIQFEPPSGQHWSIKRKIHIDHPLSGCSTYRAKYFSDAKIEKEFYATFDKNLIVLTDRDGEVVDKNAVCGACISLLKGELEKRQ